MNLSKLFEMQRELDEHIIKEKHLEDYDRTDNTVLALLVELGEFSNEWRGFKHWSNDREMRRDKALVEYVDCLHFILSIGIQDGFDPATYQQGWMSGRSVRLQILDCYLLTIKLYEHPSSHTYFYSKLLRIFFNLGRELGFSMDEIEQAYCSKNRVNHQRQMNGY